jgi:lipid-A-disaccharide synthase-like uncharacterized protein
MDWNETWFWLALGLMGNALFFSRFVVQWIASERARASVIPVAFWHLSIAGTLVLLIYAIHRRDPVFVLAYLPNAFVYARNLMLIRRQEQKRALEEEERRHASSADRPRSLGAEPSPDVAEARG